MIPFFDRIKLYWNNHTDYLSIANCYLNGLVVEANLDLAIWCYNQVIIDNVNIDDVATAYYYLGEICKHQNRVNLALNHYFNAIISANHLEARKKLFLLGSYSILGIYYITNVFEKEGRLQSAFIRYEIINNMPAIYDLEKDVKALSYYKIGCLYETLYNDIPKAFDCYKQGAVLGNKHALNVIEQNKNTSQYASFIFAEFYMNGLAFLSKNIEKAIALYKISSSLGNVTATLFLGNYYKNIQNYSLAFGYFLTAITQNHLNSFTDLQNLLQYLKDSQYFYKLMYRYYSLKMLDETIDLYNQIMNKEFEQILKNNIKFTLNDPGLIYLIAEYYLNKDELKAIYHYYQASIFNHEKSLLILQNIANTDNHHAITFLGLYYQNKKQLFEAGKCWIRAEFLCDQQASKLLANTFFDQQTCLKLANLYEENIYVPKDLHKALRFYLQSKTQNMFLISAFGNKLLSFCDTYSNLRHDFIISTWNCFMYLANVAFSTSNADFLSLSLATLENLAQDLDAKFQYDLAELYRKTDDFTQYSFWANTAKEGNFNASIKPLSEKTTQNFKSITTKNNNTNNYSIDNWLNEVTKLIK